MRIEKDEVKRGNKPFISKIVHVNRGSKLLELRSLT